MQGGKVESQTEVAEGLTSQEEEEVVEEEVEVGKEELATGTRTMISALILDHLIQAGMHL